VRRRCGLFPNYSVHLFHSGHVPPETFQHSGRCLGLSLVRNIDTIIRHNSWASVLGGPGSQDPLQYFSEWGPHGRQ